MGVLSPDLPVSEAAQGQSGCPAQDEAATLQCPRLLRRAGREGGFKPGGYGALLP
jgi:hypothetical protein